MKSRGTKLSSGAVADLSVDPVALLSAAKGGESLERLAGRVGVSFQYLAKVLSRQRTPGPKVLKFLGLRRRVVYESIGR